MTKNDDENKAPSAWRGRGGDQASGDKRRNSGSFRPAPIATRAAGDGSGPDAVWAGVSPEEIDLESHAADVSLSPANAVDADGSDGDVPVAEATVDSSRASGQGPQDPADKRKVSKNALRDGFFAQQFHTIIGDDPVAIAVFNEYLGSAADTYHPVSPVDKLRVHRLALLYYKRDEILERAETGERARSVLRHRRAVRFAPMISIAELMNKDRPALMRRSDGVRHVIDSLEDALQSVQSATTFAMAIEEVELFEHSFGAVLAPWEAKIAPVMPGLARPHSSATAPQDLMPWLRCRLQVLQTEESRLRDEEAQLAAAEEARRRVPSGKHSEKIARAAREVNRALAARDDRRHAAERTASRDV